MGVRVKNIRQSIFSKFFVLVFCSVFLFSSGCSNSSGPDDGKTVIKVAFWGSPDEINIITNSIASWQEEHPDIKVRFEHTPYGGYVSKILTRIAGGAAPDIICTEVNYFVSFASKGVLANLTPFINADTSFNKKSFFPEVLDRFTVGKSIYAIPRDTAPFACVFYNKDLFDEAGLEYPADNWTWDDMLDKAQKLTKQENGRTTQYGFYGWAWKNFIYGNGGQLVDDVKNPTKLLLDSPKSKEGLQFYIDLINKHKVMPTPVALSNSGMGVDTMFSTGKLAMFLSGVWETPGLRRRDFRWDVAMFPKNSKNVRGFGTGGSGYSILESSKNKEVAWEVVKALTGAQGQKELARRGLAQPALIDVAKGPDWAGDVASKPVNKGMLNEAVQFVTYDPFHPKWREIESKFINEELDLLFNGKETIDVVVSQITPKINAILSAKES